MNETMICKTCGEKIKTKTRLCPNCGTVLGKEKEEISTTYQKEEEFHPFGFRKKRYNKWIAFFLSLFLGWLGAHKFYEESYILGIIYLVTGGLLGIGWLFDTIRYLKKPNPYYLWKSK